MGKHGANVQEARTPQIAILLQARADRAGAAVRRRRAAQRPTHRGNVPRLPSRQLPAARVAAPPEHGRQHAGPHRARALPRRRPSQPRALGRRGKALLGAGNAKTHNLEFAWPNAPATRREWHGGWRPVQFGGRSKGALRGRLQGSLQGALRAR
ncbi:hypothetical protein M885DRAFT_326645 [Pelagophyceae sp. CCMP2097]|nr:hypothetical protein M885DRAFT_326645 [Pelagophyceae sp. CCMP2097]